MILEAKKAIQDAHKILLVAHRKPDGDTLGAVTAFAEALPSLGKKVALACRDDIPHRFRFLPHSEKFLKAFDQHQFDLMILCDAGSSHMTDFHELYPHFLSNNPPILNIDHHPTNEGYGKFNLVDPKASSTTIIVYRLFKALGIPISQPIAIALLAGIYNDTGSFKHSNTTKETFEVADELMKTGIEVTPIVSSMFKNRPISQLRLWGKILENMHLNLEGVLSMVITQKDIEASGASSEDTGGIIDLMATVPQARFAMLVTEEKNGFVKGSLRTNRDQVDVANIAAQFGGGGHKKAAGFFIEGTLKQKMVWSFLPTG